MTLLAYVEQNIAALQARVAKEAQNTLANGNPDAIHDLRVSIRRLSQALRAFEPVIGKRQARQTRRHLRRWMDEAAEIRNRDIALELLASSGTPLDSPVAKRLQAGRDQAHKRLALLLARSKP